MSSISIVFAPRRRPLLWSRKVAKAPPDRPEKRLNRFLLCPSPPCYSYYSPTSPCFMGKGMKKRESEAASRSVGVADNDPAVAVVFFFFAAVLRWADRSSGAVKNAPTTSFAFPLAFFPLFAAPSSAFCGGEKKRSKARESYFFLP